MELSSVALFSNADLDDKQAQLIDVQDQNHERAVRSLDQSGVSTCAQMTLNIETDLGGLEGSRLHAQCKLDAETSQGSLHKVQLLVTPPACKP